MQEHKAGKNEVITNLLLYNRKAELVGGLLQKKTGVYHLFGINRNNMNRKNTAAMTENQKPEMLVQTFQKVYSFNHITDN